MEPLILDGGISFEFSPDSVFEKDGKSYPYGALKKITTYKDKSGKEQKKYQNLTWKPAHLLEFIPWLEECLEELKGNVQPGGDDSDVPF